MIDPSDRRTHIGRINDPAPAKEDGMTEEQLQRLLAHITDQLEPVRRAAEMQIAYMERELAERAAYEEREAQRAADRERDRALEQAGAGEKTERNEGDAKKDAKADKKAADKA